MDESQGNISDEKKGRQNYLLLNTKLQIQFKLLRLDLSITMALENFPNKQTHTYKPL